MILSYVHIVLNLTRLVSLSQHIFLSICLHQFLKEYLLLLILFLTALGPLCCVWFSLVAETGDYSLLLHGLLMVVSLVVEHGL